jgi:hypothetical protein
MLIHIKGLPPGVMPETSTVTMTALGVLGLGLLRNRKHCW